MVQARDTLSGAVRTAPPPGAAATLGSRWLPVVGGLVGGTVAAGAAGTSTVTISLAAVWAGAAVGILVVLGATRFAVRRLRSAMPPPVLRRVSLQVLRRTVSWALVAYAFWFLVVEPELGRAGIFVPMFAH